MSTKLLTIRLECPTCRTSVAYARRVPADPPQALWALLACPGCDPAGTATPAYYDRAGQPVVATPPDVSPSVPMLAADVVRELVASAPAASVAVTAFVPGSAARACDLGPAFAGGPDQPWP